MNPNDLTACAPAKLNLFFEVLRRQESGYHEIESLVTGITLYDTLHVRLPIKNAVSSGEYEQGIHFEVQFPEDSRFQTLFKGHSIPADEKNLVVKAAYALRKIALKKWCKSESLPCADIILMKRIPSEAGLGGGSSDAATTLMLLNRLWNLNLSREELISLGADLGCDVPLFLGKLPVICRGRGEILEEVPQAEMLPKLNFILLKPPVGLSTAQVYQKCVPKEKCQQLGQEPLPGLEENHISAIINAWRENNLLGIAPHFFNRLLVSARSVSPWISLVETRFMELPDPCLAFSMTGSGSAFFGLCRDVIHAKTVAAHLKQYPIGEVFVIQTS
ncbi:MAG: 4-(cytidine 5'-diphospho)-2-C-methyl-D-erythritol kinase [Planctomycetia bacterium]|nr:4-(cytidine 5'-diphospho)-2-C-methyl-D-erythritol kinase [Planctomycetia bacterium]